MQAERTATAVPLALAVTRAGVGGVAGLTPVVAIRDGTSSTSYLDFADATFKAAGWTTRQAPLTGLGGGFYARALSVGGITNLPAGTAHLVAEYANLAGADKLAAVDTLSLVDGATAPGARVVEGTLTHDQLLRLIASAVLGTTTGVTTATETFRAAGGVTTRVTTTIDVDGNRAAVVLAP